MSCPLLRVELGGRSPLAVERVPKSKGQTRYPGRQGEAKGSPPTLPISTAVSVESLLKPRRLKESPTDLDGLAGTGRVRNSPGEWRSHGGTAESVPPGRDVAGKQADSGAANARSERRARRAETADALGGRGGPAAR